MAKFFNYYNSLCVGANSPTVFSFDPYILAIKDMLVSELRQVVFYIEKLNELNVDMSEYRDKVIEFISILIVNLDFNRESFFIIVEDLYKNKSLLNELYMRICKERNVEPEISSISSVVLSDKESIIKALNDNEMDISNSDKKLSLNKKILYQIMVSLVLNACNCLIDLKNYGVDFSEAKDEVLKLFNTSNFPASDESEWIRKIREFSKCNYKIMKKLYQKIIQNYGPVQKSNVPFAVKKGKAILVSGYNYSDLEKILDAVKDLDINVYTHNEMINAFQYNKFNSFKNLTAHYQRSNNNFSLDFSSFPGPIYISKNSTPKIDVIRGQIYTSSKYPSFGIAKIENDDFSPIIEYALNSKGFEENNFINSFEIGYREDDVKIKIDEIISKFYGNEISHISIIGLFDKFSSSNSYLSSFIDCVPDNCFVISFANSSNNDNFWNVNSYFDIPLLYLILEKLVNAIDNPSKNISVFLPDCVNRTISHIFNILHLGISKIFLGPCCPNIINPIVVDGLKNLFSIIELSTPKEDIKLIMK